MSAVAVTRHICASPYHRGPRWLLAMEFYRHPRHWTGLQSYCRACTRFSMRYENLSKRAIKNRHEYSREYKAAERRKAGVAARQLKNPTPKYGAGRTMRHEHEGPYDGKLVNKFVRSLMRSRLSNSTDTELHINGHRLSPVDQHYLNNLQSGEIKTATLARVDQLAQRYEFQLWELEEFLATA